MVKDQELLHNCKKGSGLVKLGSKAEIPIGTIGALALEISGKKVKLAEVLHVPKLRRNLLSVSKLTDMGILTVFDRRSVSFYEAGARIVGRRLSARQRKKNLYTFQGKNQEANVAVVSPSEGTADELSFLLEEPDTIDEALRGAEGAQWEKAAKAELKSMEINQVWNLVDLSEGRSVVDCKWVLKKKMSPEGQLQSPAVQSQTHLCYVVITMRQFNDKYEAEHWRLDKEILRYVKGSAKEGLEFPGGDKFKLALVVDASFGTNVKSKSTTRLCVFLHGGAIAWTSRKQTCTSVSSAEAEYLALSLGTRTLIKFTRLLEDVYRIQIRQVPVFEGSGSCPLL
ncbi:hypothetical protein R1sor_000880 [Riccia sorocarpa]|uniref:Retrovirus-related Pol polyprotein from transposon TNT 1-94-like beta-barrel domain-containing protein n=1 Tax=Riccia sorocarpa TaxID=122646 RepID=A0ABD3GUP8_9MARC